MKKIHAMVVASVLAGTLARAPLSAAPPQPVPKITTSPTVSAPSASPTASPTPVSKSSKASTKGSPGKTARPINISSDKLDYDEKKKKVRLIGKVKIVSEKMTMTAPYAEFFTDKKTAEFQGGVKMVGEGSTATGRQSRIFYNDQRAILTGNVRLVSERGAGAQPGTPTVMLCEELDYLWEKGLGKAKGRVKVRQGNRRAFSDRAVYHRFEQIVYLEGNVEFERGTDDWLSCERARMDLGAETIVAEGGVVARTRADEPKKDSATTEERPSQAKPVPLEPELPFKTVEVRPPLKLPGVDE